MGHNNETWPKSRLKNEVHAVLTLLCCSVCKQLTGQHSLRAALWLSSGRPLHASHTCTHTTHKYDQLAPSMERG